MSDFNVYYGAAEALRNTDQVYGIAFGLSSGYYKYSPEALVLFLPFSYLSYNLAAICYYLFTVFIFLGIISELKSLAYRFELNERKAEWFTVFILLLGADFIEREFFLGNVNALILYLLLLTARWANSKQEIKAGILVGIVLVLKVHFVILIPYLIWKKQ
ncbi:MAG: glycosyltransferase family 87 protein, partial [Bacteroidota bacterium]